MKKQVIIIFITFLISSCESRFARFLPERPSDEIPGFTNNSSPEFKQGWIEGCEVGMSVGSNTFYKTFYRMNRVDGYKMVGSPDYKIAWNNAYWYCYRKDWVKQKSQVWSGIFEGIR